MRGLDTFGDAKHPLRASQLPILMSCPWRLAMVHLEEAAGDSGQAADTGSAVHKAIEAWHAGADSTAALDTMRKAVKEFPLADFGEAEKHFRPYTQDPRNISAVVVAAEMPVSFDLGDGVHVQGRLDQVRLHGGRLVTIDFKTGQPDGADMLDDHLYQQAGYAFGASLKLGKTVVPGAILRTRGYRVRQVKQVDPPGVFWWYSLTSADVIALMRAVKAQCLAVRRGEMHASPGKQCRWCPAHSFLNCVPKLARLQESVNAKG